MDTVEELILHDFAKLYGEFNDLNEEVLAHLPEDESNADQLNWFNPKSVTIKTYVQQTKNMIIRVRKGTDEEKNKED